MYQEKKHQEKVAYPWSIIDIFNIFTYYLGTFIFFGKQGNNNECTCLCEQLNFLNFFFTKTIHVLACFAKQFYRICKGSVGLQATHELLNHAPIMLCCFNHNADSFDVSSLTASGLHSFIHSQ